MGQLGAYSFFAIHGAPTNLAGMKAASITRPGVDGEALWLLGKRGDNYALTSISLCTSLAAVGAAITAYKAMEQSVVTYVDDLGNTYYNQLVANVRPVEQRQVLGATTAGVTHVLTCEWTLRSIWVA